MTGSVTVITAPQAEPISLATAKAQLQVDHALDDTLIGELIEDARDWFEGFTHRQLMQATLELTLDDFPLSSGGEILIPRAPLVSVSSVKYTDTDGSEATWDASLYTIDTVSTPGRIFPAWGQTWPITQTVRNAVRIRFVAGYATGTGSPPSRDGIPSKARRAMLLALTHWYENRTPVQMGVRPHEVPMSAEYLARPLRVGGFVR